MTSKNWCFTWNNPTCTWEQLHSICRWKIKAYCVQLEKVSTEHLQGFVSFQATKNLEQVRTWIVGAHWEMSFSPEKAWTYCEKEETRIAGPWKSHDSSQLAGIGQGCRSDLSAGVQSVKEGGLTSLVENHPTLFIKYTRGFTAYASRITTKRTWKTNVIVYWGKPGSGKTRRVYEETNYNVYNAPLPADDRAAAWFDGYEGQENVLFDDFNGQYKYEFLLQLLDRYPMKVPIKGGFAEWAPRTIYITSNVEPTGWYGFKDVTALLRRLVAVTEVAGNTIQPPGIDEAQEINKWSNWQNEDFDHCEVGGNRV